MTDSGLLLLDTSVVLHLARGKATGEALDKAFGLRARADRPLISVVTVGEMISFAKQRSWGAQKLDRLLKISQELVIVDIHNQSVLDRYAEIDTYLVRLGRDIGDNDTWIAATAVAVGAVLLTTDKDFDPLHDTLLTRVYFDPQVT
jgi:tRNA(fMet)-specific endonuclease VapC